MIRKGNEPDPVASERRPRPADSRTAEFVVVMGLVILTRAMDLGATYFFSPDLGSEANPLVRYLHLHWTGLLALTTVLVGVLGWCAHYDLFANRTRYPAPGLSFAEFAPLHWFGRPRHIVFFLIRFAKDWDLRIRFIGYAGSRLAILIGIIASSTWVAAGNWPWAERAYEAVFPAYPYGLMILGAVVLLYTFLRREYHHYLRLGD